MNTLFRSSAWPQVAALFTIYLMLQAGTCQHGRHHLHVKAPRGKNTHAGAATQESVVEVAHDGQEDTCSPFEGRRLRGGMPGRDEKEAKAMDVADDPLPSVRRERASDATTPTGEHPLEQAFPKLLKAKLENPSLRLSGQESIDLLTACIAHGEENAKKVRDKEAIIVIGNTGAGKSSFVNYLAGCEMVFKSPKSVGVKGYKKVLVVKPKKEGGRMDELMPIGYDANKSKTFMPHIETTESRETYCDCPGFLDNRGAEINIANAVNIRNTINQSSGVKLLILVNYHTILGDRGRGLTDMIKICSHLFGSTKNIEAHKDSILLGVSQIPLSEEFDSEGFKECLVDGTSEIMKVLVERIFFFDPLDRKLRGAWKREECLEAIRKLKAIPDARRIFKTVLTDSDEQALLKIANSLSSSIQNLLEAGKTEEAAKAYSHLERLSPIDHPSVARLLDQAGQKINDYYGKKIALFRETCAFYHFGNAEKLLEELRSSKQRFGEVINYKMEDLERFHKESHSKYQEQERRKKEQMEAVKQAKNAARQAESATRRAESRIDSLARQLAEQRKAAQMEEQFRLGEKYYEGYGVEQDYKKALAHFHEAASEGHAGAQIKLAQMYGRGYGVTEDYRKSMEWLQKAVDQGDAVAQFGMGFLYLHEDVDDWHPEKDVEKGLELIHKAADQGSEEAQLFLGEAYRNGREGITKNLFKAQEWFRKAAAQGDECAQAALERL